MNRAAMINTLVLAGWEPCWNGGFIGAWHPSGRMVPPPYPGLVNVIIRDMPWGDVDNHTLAMLFRKVFEENGDES